MHLTAAQCLLTHYCPWATAWVNACTSSYGVPAIVVMAWLCHACRVFHKPLLVHVLSETWGMGMHLYLRAIGFQHAVMGVSHLFVIPPGFAQKPFPSCRIVSICCT